MGDSISKYYEDYDDYEALCIKHGETPVGWGLPFSKHEKEILIKYNYPGCVKETGEHVLGDH